ncbi:MAG: biotin/lipoyl-binding protein [Myxococcota bacterium]
MRPRTRQALDTFRTRFGPWLLFGISVALAFVVWRDLRLGTTVIGFAHGDEYAVGPVEPGRVTAVAVEVGQSVRQGQLIATLDTTALDRELDVLRAERARAEAELAAARVEAEREAAAARRGLEVDLADAERRLADSRATLSSASAELRSQEAERKRLGALVEAQLEIRGSLGDLDARIARLRAEADGARRSVALLEGDVAAAQRRFETERGDTVAIVTSPRAREVEVYDSRIRELLDRREARTLRAPADGQVASVSLRPGSVAGLETPIVSLVAPGAGRVIACVAETVALDVRIGDGVTAWVRHEGAQPMRGRVVGLGPIVDEVPTRCRPNLTDRVWGRDVVVLLDDPVPLIPGQALDLRLDGPRDPSGGAVASSPQPQPGEPRPLVVPAALSKRTRLEPSGAVWVSGISRYVVASDDTGLADTTEHRPWLFAVTSDGRVDTDPLPVHGVDEINDLESLTLGQAGVLYALSSQSHSKRGKRSEARRRFLALKADGRGWQVAASVLLSDLLDAMAPAARADLGIEDSLALEIEGMTADGGGLLLGLKSPLDAEGRAIIWRIAHPERLFEDGSLDRAGLSLFARLRLTADADGEPVPAGISELLLLPDGTLLVAGTPSTGDAKVETGALWWVGDAGGARGGEAQAHLITSWPGLRPEALALTPTAGRVAVFFDTGSQTPLWAEIPWPAR